MQAAPSISYYLSELHTLSTLPPNTYAHKNREGHFIATGDMAANIRGAQTIAILYKGHSHEKAVEDIDQFAEELISLLGKEAESAAGQGHSMAPLPEKTFRRHLLVNREIHQALQGRMKGGGLLGLALTYKDTDEGRKLEQTIAKLQLKAFEALQRLRDQLPNKEALTDEELGKLGVYHLEPAFSTFCPEENYSDEEWEEAIHFSGQLKNEIIGLFQYYGRYSMGLFYNQSLHTLSQPLLNSEPASWNWWDAIGHFEQGDLYLGALPISTAAGKDDLQTLEQLGIKAVLSMVDAFENRSGGYFTSPVKPEAFAQKGIKHLQVPTQDCETICFELIARGVEFIHWNLSNGRPVLVHCKAGRVRSALTLMCYLVKYQKMSAESAYDLVISKRVQAGFSKERPEWQTLKDYENFCSSK